jgi:hypothetical protein
MFICRTLLPWRCFTASHSSVCVLQFQHMGYFSSQFRPAIKLTSQLAAWCLTWAMTVTSFFSHAMCSRLLFSFLDSSFVKQMIHHEDTDALNICARGFWLECALFWRKILMHGLMDTAYTEVCSTFATTIVQKGWSGDIRLAKGNPLHL